MSWNVHKRNISRTKLSVVELNDRLIKLYIKEIDQPDLLFNKLVHINLAMGTNWMKLGRFLRL